MDKKEKPINIPFNKKSYEETIESYKHYNSTAEVSKTLIINYLTKWIKLLNRSGINSKQLVQDEMKEILKELE